MRVFVVTHDVSYWNGPVLQFLEKGDRVFEVENAYSFCGWNMYAPSTGGYAFDSKTVAYRKDKKTR